MTDYQGDLIKYQDCQITITHGLAHDGEPIFHVNVDGDLPYVYALGLLEAAKENIRTMYQGDDEQ
ncbi:hypothetical protein ABRP78_09815 [Corynebacterium sp. KPL4064]|nr:hypothetical protein [Corynebacterium kefirresidentii]MDK8838148.1 hypothetical protein [Corynebacterium kefirresidentii]